MNLWSLFQCNGHGWKTIADGLLYGKSIQFNPVFCDCRMVFQWSGTQLTPKLYAFCHLSGFFFVCVHECVLKCMSNIIFPPRHHGLHAMIYTCVHHTSVKNVFEPILHHSLQLCLTPKDWIKWMNKMKWMPCPNLCHLIFGIEHEFAIDCVFVMNFKTCLYKSSAHFSRPWRIEMWVVFSTYPSPPEPNQTKLKRTELCVKYIWICTAR